MSARPLAGKTAVITGGSRGIGRATAQAFVAAGATVALASRTQAQVEGVGLAQACDVCDAAAVERFFSLVKAQFGHIDILFNNAGTAPASAPVEQLSVEEWRRTLETNLTGTFITTRYALPLMSSGAVIVNNISVAARSSFTGWSAYNASKWGALGFTNTLREELRSRGIRVVALMPGATDTDIWSPVWPGAPRDKMMLPETVAQVVLNCVLLPPGTSADEIVLTPSSGAL